MARKPRSQRRGGGVTTSNPTATPKKSSSKKGGKRGTSADSRDDNNFETLSDTYTVADSFSVTTMIDDEEFGLEVNPEDDDDELLAGGRHDNLESAAAAAFARQAKLSEVLSAIGEHPTEKRSARREKNLRQFFRAITHWATGPVGAEAVERHTEEICNACFYSIRSGSPAEQYASCRVLEATSVILGADQDEFYDKIYTRLERIINSVTSRAVPVRMAALRALAMSCFIGTSDLEVTGNLLDLCECVADKEYRGEVVPPNLRATALDCWSLLSTTIPDLDLAGQDDVHTGRGATLLKLLKDCLDTNSPELRAAAGESMSLIHEARLNLGAHTTNAVPTDMDDINTPTDLNDLVVDDENLVIIQAKEQGTNGNDKIVMNSTDRRFGQGSWNGSEWEVLMDEVKQRIAELSVESGYKLSKKAKKMQRATFREFMATIVDDEMPNEVINFRGGTIELNSWREIIQLDFIRHCVQGGFQIQLLTNETLQSIFGADGTKLSEFATMSQLEKRLILSKNSEASKQADIKMSKNRQKRNNIKNHFLTVDGGDF